MKEALFPLCLYDPVLSIPLPPSHSIWLAILHLPLILSFDFTSKAISELPLDLFLLDLLHQMAEPLLEGIHPPFEEYPGKGSAIPLEFFLGDFDPFSCPFDFLVGLVHPSLQQLDLPGSLFFIGEAVVSKRDFLFSMAE